MDVSEEINKNLLQINHKLDIMIQIMLAKTDKKDICPHLALDMNTAVYKIIEGDDSYTIVRCITCGGLVKVKA